jgi:hypothetical protein
MMSEVGGGREIDLLVAERVMGWERREHTGLWTHNPTRQWSVAPSFVPHYSTSIKAGWQVVEALGLLVSPTLVGGWGAGVFKGRQGMAVPDGGMRYCEPGTWAEADTAPLAICLAALAAYEVARGNTPDRTT